MHLKDRLRSVRKGKSPLDFADAQEDAALISGELVREEQQKQAQEAIQKKKQEGEEGSES